MRPSVCGLERCSSSVPRNGYWRVRYCLLYRYDTVSKAVEPKRVKLREAEEELKDTMMRLDEAQEKLAQVRAVF